MDPPMAAAFSSQPRMPGPVMDRYDGWGHNWAMVGWALGLGHDVAVCIEFAKQVDSLASGWGLAMRLCWLLAPKDSMSGRHEVYV